MSQPAFFIEQINDDNKTMHTSAYPIRLLEKSEAISRKFNVNVVAVFKIYPHPKEEKQPSVFTAVYDSIINATIIAN